MIAAQRFMSHEKIDAQALRLVDFGLILTAYLMATRIAAILNEWQLFRYPSPADWLSLRMTLIPIALVSWSMVSSHAKIYDSRRDEIPSQILRNLYKSIAVWAVLSLGTVFLVKLKYSSRQFTLEFILCVGCLIVSRQLVTLLFSRYLQQSGRIEKSALVLGDKGSCERFMSHVNQSRPSGYQFYSLPESRIGFLPRDPRGSANLSGVDEIFIVGAPLGLESGDSPAVNFLRQGKAVHIVPEVIDASFFRQTLGEIAGMPVLSLTCGRLSRLETFGKRTVDLSSALVLLVLFAPFLIATTILVKLTSPGPVLFRQKRLGKEGQLFTLLKFRTMRRDAEGELLRSPELYGRYLANNYKLPAGEDPRLTAVGVVLRALSIDELPQLFNVIKGDMSLVGPRPILPAEIEKYGEFSSLLLSVKPGMTGHWQVNGRSEIREYRRRVELDLEYIRDQSMRTDLGILLRTLPSVLRRRGAF